MLEAECVKRWKRIVEEQERLNAEFLEKLLSLDKLPILDQKDDA
jgi:hypothetical protein